MQRTQHGWSLLVALTLILAMGAVVACTPGSPATPAPTSTTSAPNPGTGAAAASTPGQSGIALTLEGKGEAAGNEQKIFFGAAAKDVQFYKTLAQTDPATPSPFLEMWQPGGTWRQGTMVEMALVETNDGGSYQLYHDPTVVLSGTSPTLWALAVLTNTVGMADLPPNPTLATFDGRPITQVTMLDPNSTLEATLGEQGQVLESLERIHALVLVETTEDGPKRVILITVPSSPAPGDEPPACVTCTCQGIFCVCDWWCTILGY